MKLEYYGHSCFRLTFSSGTRIVTDPYGSIGYSLPHIGADIVTVSHGHYDQCNAAAVDGKPTVLTSGGTYHFGGVQISTVASFHDEAGGTKRGKNLIFRFRADGMEICHLGDVGEPISERLAKELASADVILLPVGGHYTIDAREAKRYVERISPKIAIPMHYYTEGLQVDIQSADAFLSLFGTSVERRGGTIELDYDAIASEKQKIIFMERIGNGL